MATIDVATGLSYPAKAERARRNPKVGLLMEGGADEPVVAMRGIAAVRDANLQRNAVRYISETGFRGIAFGLDWAGARKAVWYFTRIIVEVMPARIMWWYNPAAMDGAPHVWNAPAGTVFPQSDPKPEGQTSPASKWPQRTWREIAEGAMARGVDGHLVLVDDDGFPLSFRARGIELVDDGFRVVMPRGLPLRGTGKATLTFEGIETLVGDATVEGGTTVLKVERALPEHPLMKNPIEVLQPSDAVRRQLMARLEAETRRRGQPIPTIPEEEPKPTRMAVLRQARIATGVPITGINSSRGQRDLSYQ
jgi:hypothetical protein